MQRLLALDSSGRSVLPPLNASDRIIYADSVAGNDANDGLTTATPKENLLGGSGALALLRAGTGDRLLMKCGSTFTGPVGVVTSGVSALRPRVYGYYGSGARPIIECGTSSCFVTQGAATRSYVCIIGLRSQHTGYDGSTGSPAFSELIGTDDWILVEGNMVVGAFNAMIAPASNVNKTRISYRRNVAAYCFETRDANCGGLQMSGVHGGWFEENIIIQCGYDLEQVGSFASNQKHNVYLHESCTDIVAIGNVSIRAGAVGFYQRAGGKSWNNLTIECPTGHQTGGGDATATWKPNGTWCDTQYNIDQGSMDLQSDPPDTTSTPIGAFNVYNIVAKSDGSKSLFKHNLAIPGAVSATSPLPWRYLATSQGSKLRDIIIEGNVYYGRNGTGQLGGTAANVAGAVMTRQQVDVTSGAAAVMNTEPISANAVAQSNNRYHRSGGAVSFTVTGGSPSPATLPQYKAQSSDSTSTEVAHSHPDPSRNVENYLDMLGEVDPSIDGYIDLLLEQTPDGWRDDLMPVEINPWIRAGFVQQGGQPMPNPPSGAKINATGASAIGSIIAARRPPIGG